MEEKGLAEGLLPCDWPCVRLESRSEGPPLLQDRDVCLQVPKLSFNKHPKCTMRDDRRCTMQVIS